MSSFNIKKVNHPLNVYFPVKSAHYDTVSGEIVAPIEGIQDDDLWVKVHRLDNSEIAGFGQWRIKFKNLKPDEYFRVCKKF